MSDMVADGQTFSGVRCELCGVVRMNAMESRNGVVRCQDRFICDQVVALVAGARSTHADLIEAGWTSRQTANEEHARRLRATCEQAAETIRTSRAEESYQWLAGAQWVLEWLHEEAWQHEHPDLYPGQPPASYRLTDRFDDGEDR